MCVLTNSKKTIPKCSSLFGPNIQTTFWLWNSGWCCNLGFAIHISISNSFDEKIKKSFALCKRPWTSKNLKWHDLSTHVVSLSPYHKFIDRRILQQYGKLHLSIPFRDFSEHFPQELIAIEIYRVLPQMFLLFSIVPPKWSTSSQP